MLETDLKYISVYYQQDFKYYYYNNNTRYSYIYYTLFGLNGYMNISHSEIFIDRTSLVTGKTTNIVLQNLIQTLNEK